MFGNSSKVWGLHPLVVLLVGGIASMAYAGIGDGGSKCADASCTPAPPGAQCDPRYEREPCCPVWHCSNGQTAYGISQGSSSSSGQSTSWSSSSSGGNVDISSMFQSMLGGLFGR